MSALLSRDATREAARLDKLKSFAILDTPQEQEFDTIVSLAQRLMNVPIALVSLVDDHRQWFKASCGLARSETPREHAFCGHAIHHHDLMVVEDATLDPRFVDNPLVTGAPGIRFYAGVPLRPAADQFDDDLPGIGTLCIVDTKPRTLSASDACMLRELAALVATLIGARATATAAIRQSFETRRHADLLERQQVQLRQAERMAGIGSWRLDLADYSVHWSDHVYAIHGLPIGETPSLEEALRFYPAERRLEITTMLERCSRDGQSFEFQSDFTTADGRVRRVRSMGEPHLIDGRPVALIGMFQDITELHQREERLRQSADTDALTGLPNRACFEKRLAQTVAHCRAADEPACLLLFDLDGFKTINDTFGHAAGDEVLRITADRLRQQTHGSDFVARLGGDELVMLVTRPRDCARIESLISQLLATLHHVVEQQGQRRFVSATIGAAFLDATIGLPTDLLHRADLTLYEAKRAERGTGRLFGSAETLRPAIERAAA